MQFNKDDIEFILDVIDTAQLIGIDSVVFKPDSCGGIENSKAAAMMTSINNEFLDGYTLGINRPNVLKSRVKLGIEDPKFKVICNVDEVNKYITRLEMKTGRSTITYKCANVDTMLLPSKVSINPLFELQADIDFINNIQKMQNAMGTDVVKIGYTADNGFIEFIDINNDICNDVIDVNIISNEPPHAASYKYTSKTIISILKKAIKSSTSVKCIISDRGIFSIVVNNNNVYIVPRV